MHYVGENHVIQTGIALSNIWNTQKRTRLSRQSDPVLAPLIANRRAAVALHYKYGCCAKVRLSIARLLFDSHRDHDRQKSIAARGRAGVVHHQNSIVALLVRLHTRQKER